MEEISPCLYNIVRHIIMSDDPPKTRTPKTRTPKTPPGAGLVRELALVVILSKHESTLSRLIWIGYSEHPKQLHFTRVLQKRVPPKTSRPKTRISNSKNAHSRNHVLQNACPNGHVTQKRVLVSNATLLTNTTLTKTEETHLQTKV